MTHIGFSETKEQTMYDTKKKPPQKRATPVYIGGSAWLVKAPEGMTRVEVEQTLKIQAVCRGLYTRSLLEIIR